ncbi:MAG: hypothetical protein ACYTXC_10205 [Nostoc sp.]
MVAAKTHRFDQPGASREIITKRIVITPKASLDASGRQAGCRQAMIAAKEGNAVDLPIKSLI